MQESAFRFSVFVFVTVNFDIIRIEFIKIKIITPFSLNSSIFITTALDTKCDRLCYHIG